MTAEKKPIELACEIVGGQSELARRIGVKPQAVQKWVASGITPVRRALAVQEATENKVTAHELCPEFYPKAA
jgi:DNA-binding transcriptional regulator YdaS (Cro superfamily)